MADLVGLGGMKALWETHVYFFMQGAMKKGIIHIQLVKEPTFGSSDGE